MYVLYVSFGSRVRHNLHISLSNRCDSSTTCRLCRLELCSFCFRGELGFLNCEYIMINCITSSIEIM